MPRFWLLLFASFSFFASFLFLHFPGTSIDYVGATSGVFRLFFKWVSILSPRAGSLRQAYVKIQFKSIKQNVVNLLVSRILRAMMSRISRYYTYRYEDIKVP